MIILLARNFQQGRHYFQRLFPDESLNSRRVRIACGPLAFRGMAPGSFTAIKVGEFTGATDAEYEALLACATAGVEPIQGPRR